MQNDLNNFIEDLMRLKDYYKNWKAKIKDKLMHNIQRESMQ